MPVGDARFEMHARLDDGLAPALTGEAGFNRRKDLVVGDLQFFNVESVEIVDIDRRHEKHSRGADNMSIHYSTKHQSQCAHPKSSGCIADLAPMRPCAARRQMR